MIHVALTFSRLLNDELQAELLALRDALETQQADPGLGED